jgi:hypothetical protein
MRVIGRFNKHQGPLLARVPSLSLRLTSRTNSSVQKLIKSKLIAAAPAAAVCGSVHVQISVTGLKSGHGPRQSGTSACHGLG